MNKKTVKVYDTFTGKMVDVEVAPEVYEAYMRTEWNIHDNNETFYEHEIQFSQLIGGEKNAFENFHEFIMDGDPTAERALGEAMKTYLYKAIAALDEQDKKLIEMLFFCDMTERECADYFGINQKNINKKKQRVLATLHKLLTN